MTDTAVQDCQNYITQLQEQRSQVKEQAEGYLKMLLAQGQEVLAAMTGQPLPPPQPQPPLQPPQSQAEVLQQVLIKQEAAAAAAAALQGAGAISNSSRPPSAAASDGSMQQQPLADAGGIVPDAMPHAVRGGATDSHQQQQDQQPLPMPQPATGGADAAPLPFPGGPLSKWLNPRMQVGWHDGRGVMVGCRLCMWCLAEAERQHVNCVNNTVAQPCVCVCFLLCVVAVHRLPPALKLWL